MVGQSVIFRSEWVVAIPSVIFFPAPRAVASLTFPGGQEFHFPQILINFSYLSSNFTYFLPQFDPPGGQVAQPERPWLRHCQHCSFIYM